MRVAWGDAMTGRVAQHVLGDLTSLAVVDPFDTHQDLLVADALAPYDVAFLRAADRLNAMSVRETLLERGHVRAVALCSRCRCSGGIARAHGVDPERFDAFFHKESMNWQTVALWLDDLALNPTLSAAR